MKGDRGPYKVREKDQVVKVIKYIELSKEEVHKILSKRTTFQCVRDNYEKIKVNDMISFYEKINEKKHLSFEEAYTDLLLYFETFGVNSYSIDAMLERDQIKFMWNNIKIIIGLIREGRIYVRTSKDVEYLSTKEADKRFNKIVGEKVVKVRKVREPRPKLFDRKAYNDWYREQNKEKIKQNYINNKERLKEYYSEYNKKRKLERLNKKNEEK
jgi:hypothetical protein